jgi:hypothetical protein
MAAAAEIEIATTVVQRFFITYPCQIIGMRNDFICWLELPDFPEMYHSLKTSKGGRPY